MKFRIKLNTDNAAFCENRSAEIAAILADLVALHGGELGDVGYRVALFDSNGNRVGRAWTEGKPDTD